MSDRGTVHGTVFEDVMSDRLAKHPEIATTVAEVMGRLRNRTMYEQGLVDAILQKWERSPVNFYDAYGFLNAYALIVLGHWRVAKIHIGSGPAGDNAAEENNRRLQGLNPQFSAVFDGGWGDHDGMFRWHDHLHLGGHVCVDGELVDGPELAIGPGSISLEVGTQAVSKTLFQMHEQGAIARWPYNSDYIWVIVDCTQRKRTRARRFPEVTTSCEYDDELGWPCAYMGPHHARAGSQVTLD